MTQHWLYPVEKMTLTIRIPTEGAAPLPRSPLPPLPASPALPLLPASPTPQTPQSPQ